MKSAGSSYISILEQFVQYLHRDKECVSPRLINRAKFYARSLFISYQYACSACDNTPLTIAQVSSFFQTKFAEKNFFSDIIAMAEPGIIALFEKESIPIIGLPIGELYESLLNYETAGMIIKEGKAFRNNLGSYYTPKEYAEFISSHAIDTYLVGKKRDVLMKSRIVDFSCGCGVFFISALNHLASLGVSQSEFQTLAQNIYACDVDPIALEIAKLSVLDYCDIPEEYPSISRHFRHANFLLHSQNEASAERKLSLSMDGFIYHQELSVGLSFLQEYDIILGNPPWEKIRFEEKKFYGQFVDEIQYINFKFEPLKSIIDAKKSNKEIQEYALEYTAQLKQSKNSIKRSQFFSDSAFGELNTCALFADATFRLLSNRGAAGLFVKSSLVTAKVNSRLFQKLLTRMVAIYDFINTKKIFEIDGRERFSILTLGSKNTDNIQLAMNLTRLDDIPEQVYDIPISMFEVLNPETKMIPNILSSRDISLLAKIYKRLPTFAQSFPDAKFGRLVHLTNHVSDIDKTPGTDNIPVFEGKFFSLFDNAYSGFNGIPEDDRYKSKASSRKLTEEEKYQGIKPESRFFIKSKKWHALSKSYRADFMLAWHSLTSATNTRTCVASLLPFIPGAQSIQFLTLPNEELIYLTGVFNSITFDYIVKSKLSGIDLTQSVINQIPLPSIAHAQTKLIKGEKAIDRIMSLVQAFYTEDNTLSGLFPVQNIRKERGTDDRRSLFMELDAIVASLYQLSEEDLKHILRLFGSFYSKEEQKDILDLFKDLIR